MDHAFFLMLHKAPHIVQTVLFQSVFLDDQYQSVGDHPPSLFQYLEAHQVVILCLCLGSSSFSFVAANPPNPSVWEQDSAEVWKILEKPQNPNRPLHSVLGCALI